MEHSRVLIVNADDFGLSPGVNAGIIEACRNGIVTSTSLMVHQSAAEEAAQRARELPDLSVGLHLDLCEWVFQDGEWRSAYERVPLHDPATLEREIQVQLDRFEALTGHTPSHLDSHQHIHRSEPIRSILLRHAEARGIPVRGETHCLRYCGAFYGQSNKGDPYPQGITIENLAGVITTLPAGVTELACHPARTLDFQSVYLRERLTELRVLCDPVIRAAVEQTGIQLSNFLDPGVQGLVRATR